MNLKFAHPQINEYATGNFYFKNDGKAFEVDAVMGRELLWAKASVDGEMVNVFEEAGKPAVADEPDTVESLAKRGRKELEAMAKEAGLDGDSYTNKQELAAAILAAKGE